MWRHLLYLLGTIGVALLAALLTALVVESRLAGAALSGRLRQVTALVGMMLVGGSGYIMFCWCQYILTARGHLDP
jgi:hypothetical protein